eukprot:357392-Chlamydomonas_euryale.AAC.1
MGTATRSPQQLLERGSEPRQKNCLRPWLPQLPRQGLKQLNPDLGHRPPQGCLPRPTRRRLQRSPPKWPALWRSRSLVRSPVRCCWPERCRRRTTRRRRRSPARWLRIRCFETGPGKRPDCSAALRPPAAAAPHTASTSATPSSWSDLGAGERTALRRKGEDRG